MEEVEFQYSVYALIPNDMEKAYKKKHKQNNQVLHSLINMPQKNLSKKQVKAIIQKGNYILRRTEDIAEKFLEIGNLINKAVSSLDLDENKYYGRNTYIESIFNEKESEILSYKDKEGITIDKKTKNLLKEYLYQTRNYKEFYCFLYNFWELIYLSYKQKGVRTKIPILFNQYYVKEGTIEENIHSKLTWFLTKYEQLTHFKFHIESIYTEDDKDNYDSLYFYKMLMATEDIRMPLVYELMNNIACKEKTQKYEICNNKNCMNLYLKTRNNRMYCGDNYCKSDLVQVSKAKSKSNGNNKKIKGKITKKKKPMV